MTIIGLESEIIQRLQVLSGNDRDIKTLAIFCNPNFIRGSDKKVQQEILKILNKLKKEGKVSKKRRKIRVGLPNNKRTFILWSLI